ncbi:histidine phosphatase family protein [Spirosoma foliorum]|uniref:Histidine phosphatase family protein n=1 Tax=Spirosoma foliorum TaxID=2710596 RepID=A0A7G5GRH4_9BACT|nr:histidine phosphatase family protein [Spirosoma foliorum]QMW01466.1 histidine phosphatase family protein [Spirosoma foliorum]
MAIKTTSFFIEKCFHRIWIALKMPIFYFIRHGQSEGNRSLHLICGRSNHHPLTDVGIIQSEKLGYRLKDECIKFDHWFSSIAERAIQTADIIGRINDLPQASLSAQLQEQWMGDWEGQPRAQIYTEEVVQLMNADNWHYKCHNGESQFEVENRMYDFIKPFLSLPSEATIGIVTHGIAIRCLLRKLLDSSPSMTRKIQLNNTSLTILRYIRFSWYIERINDYSHLVK